MSGYGKSRQVIEALSLSSVEVFLAILSILSGLPTVISGGSLAPKTMQALPQWTVILWGLVLAVGGSLALTGIGMRAIRIERAGVLLLGSASAVLFLVLVGYPSSSILGLVLYAMFAWAMFARYWVLGRTLKSIARVKAQLPAVEGDEHGSAD